MYLYTFLFFLACFVHFSVWWLHFKADFHWNFLLWSVHAGCLRAPIKVEKQHFSPNISGRMLISLSASSPTHSACRLHFTCMLQTFISLAFHPFCQQLSQAFFLCGFWQEGHSQGCVCQHVSPASHSWLQELLPFYQSSACARAWVMH